MERQGDLSHCYSLRTQKLDGCKIVHIIATGMSGAKF